LSIRIFTLEEARRTLPLVRRIAADIVEAYEQLLENRGRQADARGEALEALEDASHDLRDRIITLDRELAELGAVTKGVGEGLVDWYGELDGRIVYFCWQLGEPEIEWYHDLDAGFSGRVRLPAALSPRAP
jgi:hypothetical protein